jgi:hypothetical protein
LLVLTGDHVGSVFLKDGALSYVEIHDKKLAPRKAFGRMVGWEHGHFELKAASDVPFPEDMKQSTESLLLEALRQYDEIKRIAAGLPKPTDAVIIAKPMKGKLRDLSPEQLDVLQHFVEAANYEAALDSWPGDDYDIIMQLHPLLKDGFLQIG